MTGEGSKRDGGEIVSTEAGGVSGVSLESAVAMRDGAVLHCLYCHGWEVRDRPAGALATGPLSVHQTLRCRQLSDSAGLVVEDTDRAIARLTNAQTVR